MRYVIIGCGGIGMELAQRWVESGHQVLGTTTTPERVAELKEVCTDTAVLRGSEAEKVQETVRGADAVVVAVSPRFDTVFARRERTIEFRDSLIGTARTVAGAHRRVVLLSRTFVYGDGGDGDQPVDEQTLPTIDLEPSAQAYGAAERVVLEYPAGAVLRLPIVVNQPGSAELARRTLEHSGGVLPIAGDSLAYRLDYRDAAAAVEFVVEHELTGVYNVVPDGTVPPPFAQMYHHLTDGGEPIKFLDDMKMPTRPISSAKLREAGFTFQYA